MGMTQTQDIPIQKQEQSTWSTRRLFPFTALSNAFVKTFINVYDVLLGFSLLIIGITEVLNRNVSWIFYIVVIVLIAASLYERHQSRLVESTKSKDK